MDFVAEIAYYLTLVTIVHVNKKIYLKIKMTKKGQSNIIGFMIITLIILVVVSTTFFWANDLLGDSAHVNEMGRMENRMLELDKAIREVANEQSQRNIKFEIESGYFFIENNHTLTYSFNRNPPKSFDSSGVAILGNTSTVGPCFNYSIISTLGEDRSSCIIKKGRDIKINYIVLNETNTQDCYSVQFESGGTAAAGKGIHNILLTYSHTNITSDCNNSYIRVIKVDID
jgi:hypothetical protein